MISPTDLVTDPPGHLPALLVVHSAALLLGHAAAASTSCTWHTQVDTMIRLLTVTGPCTCVARGASGPPAPAPGVSRCPARGISSPPPPPPGRPVPSTS